MDEETDRYTKPMIEMLGAFTKNEYTGCTTVNRMKENDITQLVDTVERYTRSQMKADEFQFMLIRFIIICMIWMLEKNALLLTSMNSGVD